MKNTKFARTRGRLVSIRNSLLLLGMVAISGVPISPTYAQKIKPKSYQKQSVTTYPFSGYNQVGDTRIYYSQGDYIDIIGRFQDYYYGSTYSNRGYKVALKVNNGTAQMVSCNGAQLDGVKFNAWVEPQGELARICYAFTNTTDDEVTISAGTHADVMIGNNDRAPITRRKDTTGSTYGLTMSDGGGAQLCVLFGNGLKGVTSVNDFWFDYYYENESPYQMVGDYSHGSNWMQENGSYDSGMGWCWKNRRIAAGETLVLSYLIGVGEVNLQPSSNVEVTPDDPDGWNDLSRPHRLTLSGTYDSPAGLDGTIQYAVEDSEEWHALTDALSSGTDFSQSIVVNFDEGRPQHTIRLRTVDAVGNTSNLLPIEYVDVASHSFEGTRNYVYTGDSIYQTDITSDLPTEQYVLKNYHNNVNAGTASYSVEGVFPYTIGRRSYQFEISPQPLSGSIQLSDSTYVYNGNPVFPRWSFSKPAYHALVEGTDYVKTLSDNVLPGTATLTITGRGNYTSTLSAQYDIDKAPLRSNLYHITLPNADITYDGTPHLADATQTEGVGEIKILYQKQDNSYVTSPTDEGTYTVYAEISEGNLYYGCPRYELGTFSIYRMDQTEWGALAMLNQSLSAMGSTRVWDMSQGIKSLTNMTGVKVEKGHVKSLNLSNLNLTGELPQSIYALRQVERLELQNNHLKGNLGLLGQVMPALTYLNASHNAFSDLYPMLPTTLTTLDVTQQQIDKTITIDGSDFDASSLLSQMPTILAYDHLQQKYRTNLEMILSGPTEISADGVDNTWSVYFEFNNGQIGEFRPWISGIYRGESGDTLTASLYTEMPAKGSTFKVKYIFEPGDANFSKGVNATDLQATILYTFGLAYTTLFNFTAADTYRDGRINVQDVVSMVNILLDKASQQALQANSMAYRPVTMNGQDDENAEAEVFLKDGKVWFYATRPVAALSIQATGHIDWQLSPFGLQQSTRAAHLVGYSLSGQQLPVGELVEIGTYSGEAELISASLSDVEAKAVKTSLSGGAITSISDALQEGNAQPFKVYNLKGIQTQQLQKGVNILQQGKEVKKVIIK